MYSNQFPAIYRKEKSLVSIQANDAEFWQNKNRFGSVDSKHEPVSKGVSINSACTRKNSLFNFNIRRQIHVEFGLDVISTYSGDSQRPVSIKKLEIFDKNGERLLARNLYFKIVNCKVLNEVNEQVFNSDDCSPVIFVKSNEDYPCTIKFLFKTDRPIASVKILNEKIDSPFDLVKKIRLSIADRDFFTGTLNIGANLLMVVVRSITGFKAEGEDQRSIDSINSLHPFEAIRKVQDENLRLSPNQKMPPQPEDQRVSSPTESNRVPLKSSFANDLNYKSNDNRGQNRKRKPVINKSLINLEQINPINISKNTTTIDKDSNMPEIVASSNKLYSNPEHKDSKAQIKEIANYSNFKSLMQIAGHSKNIASHKQLKQPADSSVIKHKAFFIQSLLKNVDFFRNTHHDSDKPSTIKLNLKEKLKVAPCKSSSSNPFMSRILPHKHMTIPLLPQGRRLSLEMYSNWGHVKYIGFASMMVFDEDGNPLPLCSSWVSIAPESTASHHIDSIFRFGNLGQNGKNFLCKLDPSQQNQSFKVTLDLQTTKRLSAIKIENFSTSAIFSIGVKHAVLTLDDQPIFFGQISSAESNGQQTTSSIEPSNPVTYSYQLNPLHN
jgi:hypothetical protein